MKTNKILRTEIITPKSSAHKFPILVSSPCDVANYNAEECSTVVRSAFQLHTQKSAAASLQPPEYIPVCLAAKTVAFTKP
jgi:hypothetical protein